MGRQQKVGETEGGGGEGLLDVRCRNAFNSEDPCVCGLMSALAIQKTNTAIQENTGGRAIEHDCFVVMLLFIFLR
jgi:hypothetical protein